MDHDVMFALMDRVLKIGRNTPHRLPGRFAWKFRDKEDQPYSMRIKVSAPIFVEGTPEYEVEYQVITPKVRVPIGTVTIRQKGRMRTSFER